MNARPTQFLNLDIASPRVRDFTVTQERELGAADVALLALNLETKAPSRKRLTDRHHALARVLASGSSAGHAAAIVGYAATTVSILLDDPSFKELIAFYRESVDTQYAQMHDMLAGMSKDAVIELRDRLEDDPSKFSGDMLLRMAAMGADRTGHGPSSKQEVNVNVSLATRLEEARRRVNARVIDITPMKVEL